MILTIILISIIIILGFVAYIFFQSMMDLSKEIKKQGEVIKAVQYNNRELRKELQRLQIIENEGMEKIEKINNTANSGVADILNDKLSDSGSKS